MPTKSKPPTKEERAIARRVLKYYQKQSFKLAETTEQEKPSKWATGNEDWVILLQGDPQKTMDEYLAEYKAGH